MFVEVNQVRCSVLLYHIGHLPQVIVSCVKPNVNRCLLEHLNHKPLKQDINRPYQTHNGEYTMN